MYICMYVLQEKCILVIVFLLSLIRRPNENSIIKNCENKKDHPYLTILYLYKISNLSKKLAMPTANYYA